MSEFVDQPPLDGPAARAASSGSGLAPDRWAALVPELRVSDLRPILAFWRGLLGFSVTYGRPATPAI